MPPALDAEALVLGVLLQLMVIIAAARLGGWAGSRLGQPQVVGEIAAGLVLGPSVAGRLLPELHARIFPGDAEAVFQVLGQLGLVFLMFLVGLQFEFAHLRRLGRAAAGVALAGLLLPFLLGLGLGTYLHPHVAAGLNRTGFVLFLATALSITAVPILARIMVEFGLTRTRLGVLTISAAAVDDAVGWVLLAAVSAIVAGGFEAAAVGRMLGLTLLFVAAMVLVARPLLVRFSRRALGSGPAPRLDLIPFSFLLLCILATAAATGAIGIFAIFGPFVLGAALWDQDRLREAAGSRLWDFVNAFFLPVFFTYTGLRTDVGLLDSVAMWLFCGLVLLTAVAGKVLGCGLAARLGGMDWRDSAAVAVLMNTRALMGLVVINVGRDMGVIPDTVFSMLVIMALVTTFMASPLLRRLAPTPGAPA